MPLVNIPHINEWTGLPCHCPWHKPHLRHLRIAFVQEAGQNLNKVLKAPDKAFKTPEGQAFREQLAQELGEEHDPLAPFIAQRWKKGEIRQHPESNDLWYKRNPQYIPDGPEGGWNRLDWNPLESSLPRWTQWFNARQHPTRRGVNIMDPKFTVRDIEQKAAAHQEALAREKQIREQLQHGTVHHTFPAVPEQGIDWNKVHNEYGYDPQTRRDLQILQEGLAYPDPYVDPDVDPEDTGQQEFRRGELQNLHDELEDKFTVPARKAGWHVRHLTAPGTDTEAALSGEGRAMSHCIGSHSQPYQNCAQQGKIDVYSLRDPQGWPHGTWHTNNSDGSIAEVFGHSDRGLNPQHQQMYEEWCAAHGYDPEAVGHQEDAEDPEITIPAADDVDSYLNLHGEGNWSEYIPDDANYGEDTEINFEPPDLEGVASDLYHRADPSRPYNRWDDPHDDLNNVYNTAVNNTHLPAFNEAMMNHPITEPHEQQVRQQWEQMMQPHYHPYTGELSNTPVMSEFQKPMFEPNMNGPSWAPGAPEQNQENPWNYTAFSKWKFTYGPPDSDILNNPSVDSAPSWSHLTECPKCHKNHPPDQPCELWPFEPHKASWGFEDEGLDPVIDPFRNWLSAAWEDSPEGYNIYDINVDPKYRGQGYGSRLMNRLRYHADQNQTPLNVTRVTNHPFFEKFDWLKPSSPDSYTYNPTYSKTAGQTHPNYKTGLPCHCGFNWVKWKQREHRRFAQPITPMGPGTMYHVSPRKNRESILRHGLQGYNREELGSPWNYTWGQPAGNYLFDNPEDAQDYARGLHHRSNTEPDWEDRYTWGEPIGFHHWSPEEQEQWYDDEDNEPQERTEDPNGYDIYRVHAHGMPIVPDPESQTIGQGDNPGRSGPWDIGRIHDIENEEANDPWGNPYGMSDWGDEPRRYLIPQDIHPSQIQLHQHVPSWDLAENDPDDEGYAERSYPQPWAQIPLTEKPFPGHEAKTATWDPTICEHCSSPMTEPVPVGNKLMNHCTRCGLWREVPGNSPVYVQQQKWNFPEYPAELQAVDPGNRPWILTHQKTADKLHDFLMNPKSRPDLQTPEGQAFLQHLGDYYHNEKTDPLMPWLTREWKKKRLEWGAPSTGFDNPAMEEARRQAAPSLRYYPNGYSTVLRPDTLNHWADFNKTNHPVRRQMGDIMQHDIHSFQDHVGQWNQAMAQEAHDKALQGGQVVHTTPQNWTIRNLTQPDELKAEGDAMGHCVGGYDQAVANGNSLIYSLRDPQGRPHSTIEIEPTRHQWIDSKGQIHRPSNGSTGEWPIDLEQRNQKGLYPNITPIPHNGNLVQIQGKGNQEPLPEYKQQIRHWFESFPEHERPQWDHEGDYLYRPDHISEEDLDPSGVDEYGLGKPPIKVNWGSMLDHSFSPAPAWADEPYDYTKAQMVYDLAKAHNQIPQLAQAAGEFSDKQIENFDNWREQAQMSAPNEYPTYPDESMFENADGSFDEEAYSQAEKQYEKMEEEIASEHPSIQAVQHINEMLNPHFNLDTQQYHNEIFQPPVAHPPTAFSSVDSDAILSSMDKVAYLRQKYGELLTQPGHQLWYRPNKTYRREPIPGRGIVHIPSQTVHTWNEFDPKTGEQEEHDKMIAAKGFNREDTVGFNINPNGVVYRIYGPDWTQGGQSPKSYLDMIAEADPALAQANGYGTFSKSLESAA